MVSVSDFYHMEVGKPWASAAINAHYTIQISENLQRAMIIFDKIFRLILGKTNYDINKDNL